MTLTLQQVCKINPHCFVKHVLMYDKRLTEKTAL